MKPLISIVIPLYNKESSILKTIQSVISQTYTDYELIVVNDGSTDNGTKIVENYPDTRINLINKENGGVCSARNRGIQEAKGEYIALLDADDLWDIKYLEEQVRMIHDFPEAAMWSINYAETRNGEIVRRVPTGLPDGYRGYVEHYFEMPERVSDLFHPSSTIVKKEVFDKVGLFDERIKYAEDSDLWFRINALYKTAFYDRYMVSYQLDAENRAMTRRRVLRYFLPYYVDKYREPIFKQNQIFYRWINRWCAVHIRRYYFSPYELDRREAREAAVKLDYSVIPFKYMLFFKLPYRIAEGVNKMDQWRRNGR